MIVDQFAEKFNLWRTSKKRLDPWLVGYGVMRDFWDSYSLVPRETRISNQFGLRSTAILFPAAATRGMDLDQISSDRPDRTFPTIDKLLASFHTDDTHHLFQFHNLFNIALDADFNLDEFISAHSFSMKKDMFEIFGKYNGNNDAAFLIDNLAQQTSDLHIRKLSANPVTNWRYIKSDMAKLREDPAFHPWDVRGISWLVTPQTKILTALDMGPEMGTQLYFPDVNGLVEGEVNLPEGIPATKQELFEASVQNIQFSTDSIQKFLLEGSLPNVGVMRIPADVFFKNAPKTVIFGQK